MDMTDKIMYEPNADRYGKMKYPYCGKSGLRLPVISLGLWQNFGEGDDFENQKRMVLRAFDHGITHFDIANNYGPPGGAAELNFGRILHHELSAYRNELVISTKAGFPMWRGPYGDGGSRKYLISSLDASLTRLGLDYVDIFYHHRPDPATPLEETMMALSDIVISGRALYIGLSNYTKEQLEDAVKILKELKTPLLIIQPRYNMIDRAAEETGLLKAASKAGAGCICYSPLAQGILTDKYINGIPEGSRASKSRFLRASSITPELIEKIKKLNELAASRGQTLAQMALAWVKNNPAVTSVLIGASRPEQIDDAVGMMEHPDFTAEELAEIDKIILGS